MTVRRKASDFEVPDTIFSTPARNDFANQYLTASEEEDQETMEKVSARIARGEFGQERHRSVQAIARSTQIAYPPATGARVAFSRKAEAVFAYDNPPMPGQYGTVITVRTASGNTNHYDGKVFVRWDNGQTLPTFAEHLSVGVGAPRVADAVVRRASSLGDLTEFLKVGSDTLVHKATKDLWAVKKSGQDVILERLFDETGTPLKV